MVSDSNAASPIDPAVAQAVRDWVVRLRDPDADWWTDRPASCPWQALLDAAGSNVRRPSGMERPEYMRADDEVQPLVARAMLCPDGMVGAFTTLPWSVLCATQGTRTNVTREVTGRTPALTMVLPMVPDAAVLRLAERALDDAAKVFNDPSFQFAEQDLPLNDRGYFPTALGTAHRPAWSTVQHQRVRRCLTGLMQGLVQAEGAPDDATVVRWQRWAMVLSCTTYSQAEAAVTEALVRHGQPVPLRTVTPTTVLRRVPDMPVGFFASLQAQGFDLAACGGYYAQVSGGKWKSMPEEAVAHERSVAAQRALRFNLLDLAALRGRMDLVGWCMDQGLQFNGAIADTLLARLRTSLDEATPGQREAAAKRLLGVERALLQSALPAGGPTTGPVAPAPRRRL